LLPEWQRIGAAAAQPPPPSSRRIGENPPNKERKEKKAKAKERKESFRLLCEEARASSKTSYSDFNNEHGKDKRYKATEKSRDWESVFNESIIDMKKKEKEDREEKRKSAKKELLKDKEEIDWHSHWSDVKKLIQDDYRNKEKESSRSRPCQRSASRSRSCSESWDKKKRRKDRSRRGDNKRKAEKEAGEAHSYGERKKIKTENGNRDDLSEDEEDRETREQKEKHILISFTDLDHLKKCLESWTGQRLEDEAEGPKLTDSCDLDSCDLVSRILEENGIKG
jgi:hypothetical protein